MNALEHTRVETTLDHNLILESSDQSNNGSPATLYLLPLFLCRRCTLTGDSKFPEICTAGRRRTDLRPKVTASKLLPLPTRAPPLLHRMPPSSMFTVYTGRDSVLVLSELFVRSTEQHCEERRQQVLNADGLRP
jgi:hypothetical protein